MDLYKGKIVYFYASVDFTSDLTPKKTSVVGTVSAS